MITAAVKTTPRPTEPAFLTRVRLRARRRVLWLRRVWAEGLAEPEQGLAIPHSEVDRVLADPREAAEAEDAFYEGDAQARRLTEEIREADGHAADEAPWRRLAREFGLSGPEVDLLMLTVAVDVDPALLRACGYLNDDATACRPTPWLAAGLFQWPACVRPGPESGLVRWGLARPADGAAVPWSGTSPWAADPYLVSWVVQGHGRDPVLGDAILPVAAEDIPPTCLYSELLAEMKAFAAALLEQRRRPHGGRHGVEIELIGPEGSGKRTLAAQLCAELGAGLVLADAGVLLGPDVALPLAAERALHAVRLARLNGAVLYWQDAGAANPRAWAAVRGSADLTLFGAAAADSGPKRVEVPRRSFRLPPLTRAQRVALWAGLCDRPAPEPVADWMLTPAEVAAAARVAPAGPRAVVEACRRELSQGPGGLITPLACPYTWDDIVLASQTRGHLEELQNQARLRWPVYEDWGFERLCPVGRGIAALFAGSTGTGKTMAAQVLARALGMELYRVDLAGVMSKYIGETEKNLKQIFDTCERANVLLFFDEADAVFGQRTQVKDAHDRYANIEVDYLLQRMEQFDGIAVLATNRKGDIDKAFLRRMRFIVDFLQPGPAERLALWRRALLPRAPDGTELLDAIDYEFLADRLTMSGADIKGAALAAAFLARAEGTRIAMRHVLHTARREMAKHGEVLRPGDPACIREGLCQTSRSNG
jgi:AAA+ superfamily predicted ATPase